MSNVVACPNAGKHPVEALQVAVPLPRHQLVRVESIVGRVALAEHEPVAAVPCGDPRLQQRTKTGLRYLLSERDAEFNHYGLVGRSRAVIDIEGLQLSGFMGMNFDRHVTAHRDLFHNLIRGDGDSAEKHREFYDDRRESETSTSAQGGHTSDVQLAESAQPAGQTTGTDESPQSGVTTTETGAKRGSFFRNISSMRRVTRKPPKTLTAASATASTPMPLPSQVLVSAAASMAAKSDLRAFMDFPPQE